MKKKQKLAKCLSSKYIAGLAQKKLIKHKMREKLWMQVKQERQVLFWGFLPYLQDPSFHFHGVKPCYGESPTRPHTRIQANKGGSSVQEWSRDKHVKQNVPSGKATCMSKTTLDDEGKQNLLWEFITPSSVFHNFTVWIHAPSVMQKNPQREI